MKRIWEFVRPYKKLAFFAPLFMLLEVASELLMPKLMTILLNRGVGGQDPSVIAGVGTVMAVVILLGILGGIGCLICASLVSQKTGTDIRRAVFVKIQDFSFHNIDTFQTPSLITRLTNDITQIQVMVLMLLRTVIRAPLLCVGSMFMTFSINARIALLFLGIMVLLGVTVGIILRFALPRFKIVQKKLDSVNTVMRECLAGMRVVKAFVRSDFETKKFDGVNQDYKKTSVGAYRIMLLNMPATMLILNCAIIAILWFGGMEAQAGRIGAEDIMAFITYLIQMMMAFMVVAMIFMYISRAKVSLDRVTEVLDEKVDIKEPEHPVLPEKNEGRVEFRDVSFRYKVGSGDPVLEHISFTAEPGQTIGILGETGSGKSTLVNLIPRLYDVTEGSILVDGVDVRNYRLKDLRKKAAVVLQETVLFTGTIKDNILWGREDASEEDVIKAAKAAQAHDFILSLPEGYDTELGQRGVNVSGGQKQRISIARALIQDPEIIIFDDSTSAVDSLTEKNIRQALQEAHRDCTKFIIAQRISSVRHADKILVLGSGQILAQGSHEELMETSEEYRQILASQMKKGEVCHA